MSKLRSARWFGSDDLTGVVNRAPLRAQGFSRDSFDGKPVIGICNSWSELVHCNVHFRGLAQAVKRGVLQAGGFPLEFPTISLSENLMKPTTMMYRNLMAMDVEESIRSQPLDAVVLLGGCDKTVPAQIMGAASAGIPAIMVTGGPAIPAVWRGHRMGAGTDLWKMADEFRAGRITAEEFSEVEAAATPSVGHCNEMGTASTMTSVVEAMGMTLPGNASIPAADARRYTVAEQTGRRAVEMALEGLTPDKVITPKSIDNAITALMAIGGSTNAVIHLIAIAGRLGFELPLERFDEISRRTPLIANIRPSGKYLVEELFHAGGIPAVLAELEPLLELDALTVTGRTLGEELRKRSDDRDVIASLDNPIEPRGGIATLRGSLAPNGAVIKRSAASPELLKHRGPAVVFEDIYDVGARFDDPSLDIRPDSVLVLRNSGPVGAPGMPEWGQMPIPERLLKQGVRDMVRISDARMSGTAFGTVVLHISPESAVGGPLALVQNGDPIVLDVDNNRLDLDLPEEELERRRRDLKLPDPRYRRGYGRLFTEHVLQADQGCDFDFLRAVEGEEGTEPYGLLTGWIGGW